jgi:outer membrane protein assembly factor BamB
MKVLKAVGLVLIVAASAVAGDQAPPKGFALASWAQWRGPARNGVDIHSPKLLDKWPEKGPKQLWKSEAFPSGREGGCGSVTVAGGKAFMFVHVNKQTSKIVMPTTWLKEHGWVEDMPADLKKKVEAARSVLNRKYYRRRPTDAQLADAAKVFLATLPAAQVEKYGAAIRVRLGSGRKLSGKSLRDLATVRDKEFDSISALNRGIKYEGYGNIFHPHNKDGGIVKSYFLAQHWGWTDIVVCLNADTGKTLWKKEFPGTAANKGTYYYAASCTPAVADGKCYVAGSGGFYCLSTENGDVVWQRKLEYSNSAPLVDNGVVYILAKKLTALDAAKGDVIWQQPKIVQQNSSVTMWISGGVKYLLAFSGTYVYCAEAKTGVVMWKAYTGKGASDCSPVVSGDILVARFYSGLCAFKITPKKAERIWAQKERCGDRGSTPAIYDGHVYITGSMYGVRSACCIDLKTGEMKWKQSFPKLETCSPIIADGKVFAYVKNKKNKKKLATIMYKADPEKFQQLGMIDTSAGPCSSPTIANGRLYLRLKDHVACYDVKAK